jgi:hypothetical protein
MDKDVGGGTRFLNSRTKRTLYKTAYILLFVLLVINVSVRFIFVPGFDWAERTMLADVVYGRAHKPFVYRTLLPSTVRLIVSLIPTQVREAIEGVDWRTSGSEGAFTEFLVTCSVLCATLAGFCLAVRYLCKGVFRAPPLFADLVSLGALVGLPPFFTYYSYIYDFSTLLLFALGLGLMVRRRWGLYLFVFVLACLNKETAVLLTWVFAFSWFGRRPMLGRKRFNWLLGLQLGIYLLLRLGILWIYRDNPGRAVEFHLFDHNVAELLRPYPLSTLCVGLGIVLAVFYRWSEKPLFLRIGASVLLPLLGSTLLFGFIDELRDYYEAYPALLLLISHSVGTTLGMRITATADSQLTQQGPGGEGARAPG